MSHCEMSFWDEKNVSRERKKLCNEFLIEKTHKKTLIHLNSSVNGSSREEKELAMKA